jgi:UDP:flavonoid glycosyltransferase YjiC (YdhE family)
MALHAILVTIGTDGDVYPYLGLGTRLRALGHRVTLVANERYRCLALEHGLGFQQLISDAEFHQALDNPDFWHPLKSGWVAARWGVQFFRRQYDVLAELAQDGPTVFAASPGVLPARLIQDKLQRPVATVFLQPGIIPSLTEPPIMPGGLTLPSWAPRPLGQLYWRLVDGVGDLLVGRHLNRVRFSLGLAPVRRLFRWWLSPELAIGLWPAWYGPPQPDWPRQIRLASFPMYDGRLAPSLPADVLAFCRAGPPPIAFTFGTGMRHARRMFRAAVTACGRLGRRGLLLTRFREQLPATLPPFIHVCDYAPFLQLFPLCAAVVHHGGIGTTARALAAGTPQLVLHLAYDQHDNATRVERLGVGAGLPAQQRGAGGIARALAALLTPQTQARCRAVAAQFGTEDSLAVAARWIEELGLQSCARSPAFLQ